MRREGFTLLELLLVAGILGVLLALLYLYIAPTRQRANLAAGLNYARSVATSLEALRNPQTGALPENPTDCTQGFGDRPAAVVGCTVDYPDPTSFVIQIELRGATHSRVVYDGRTGELASLP